MTVAPRCTPDGPADPPPCGEVCATCPVPLGTGIGSLDRDRPRWRDRLAAWLADSARLNTAEHPYRRW
jgi:hypothetical protein